MPNRYYLSRISYAARWMEDVRDLIASRVSRGLRSRHRACDVIAIDQRDVDAQLPILGVSKH